MPSFPQLRAWITPDGAAALLAARGPELAAGLLVLPVVVYIVTAKAVYRYA